jgi:hypothetical protein
MPIVAVLIDLLREIWNDRELRIVFTITIVAMASCALLGAPLSAYIPVAFGFLSGVLLWAFSEKESVNVKMPERQLGELKLEAPPAEEEETVPKEERAEEEAAPAYMPPEEAPPPTEAPLFPTSTEGTLSEEISELKERLRKQEERNAELVDLLLKVKEKLGEKKEKKELDRSEMNVVPIAKKHGVDAVTLDAISSALEGFETPQELTLDWFKEQIGERMDDLPKYVRALRVLKFRIMKKGKVYLLEKK